MSQIMKPEPISDFYAAWGIPSGHQKHSARLYSGKTTLLPLFYRTVSIIAILCHKIQNKEDPKNKSSDHIILRPVFPPNKPQKPPTLRYKPPCTKWCVIYLPTAFYANGKNQMRNPGMSWSLEKNQNRQWSSD